MEYLDLFGIRINNVSSKELLQELNNGILFTPNVDHVVRFNKDKKFRDIYSRADWIICDSKIIRLAGIMLGKRVVETIPGSTFFNQYYKYHAKNENVRIFLLGAMSGVAEVAKSRINKYVDREIIVSTYSPDFSKRGENDRIIKLINSSEANVLVVGLGSPKQEEWIIKNSKLLNRIKLSMALGATIDFEAGNIKRAPRLFQVLYLEWFYRFLVEPNRLFKRYFLYDTYFFVLFFSEFFGLFLNIFNQNKTR